MFPNHIHPQCNYQDNDVSNIQYFIWISFVNEMHSEEEEEEKKKINHKNKKHITKSGKGCGGRICPGHYLGGHVVPTEASTRDSTGECPGNLPGNPKGLE